MYIEMLHLLINGVLMANQKKLDSDEISRKLYENAYDDYVNNGDIKKALEEYNRVIQMNPRFADAYFDLGFIYNSIGKKTEAIIHFKNYLEHNPYARDRDEIESIIESLKLMQSKNIKVKYIRKAINI